MKKIFLCLLAFVNISLANADDVTTVTSPDGKNTVTVTLNDEEELLYAISRNGQEVVSPSHIGFKTSAKLFVKNLRVDSVATSSVDESYTLPVGKRSTYRNNYNEARVSLSKTSTAFDVVFRAYNDGIAFRIDFPTKRAVTITADSTVINIPTLKKTWAMQYKNSYEAFYTGRTWLTINHSDEKKFCAPMLVKSSLGDDYYTLITEACIDNNGCVSALLADEERTNTGRFSFVMDGNESFTAPGSLPWKVIFVGPLTNIAVSSLLENLNPPTVIDDTSWIQPGLSSWDWGGNDGSQTRDMDFIHQTIDLASEMGWPYMTLDDGWDGADYQLTDVTSYAKEKGVGILIWSNQNRFQNDESQIRSILTDWKNKGFVGSKIDFFEDDSQNMSRKYEKLLKVAAELQMVLNFHGCTKPSGRRRTYPNHLSSEAVYGNEMYYYIGDACPNNHHVNLCLTRNVMGPMEFTPGEYANRNGVCRHCTTWSGQTALFGLFESGVQTVADCYDNIINNPVAPLLKVIPAAWDESGCIEAEPDKYITMWKRKGEDYYLSTISKDARSVTLPLDFLGNGYYTAQIWKDGVCYSDVTYEDMIVSKSSSISLDVHANGGAIIRLSKNPVHQPQYTRVEIESGTITGASIKDDTNFNCGEGKLVNNFGNGSKVICKVDVPCAGRYYLTLYYITWEDRDLYIQINGGDKTNYTMPGNGGTWNSDGIQFHRIEVDLKAGTNTITFGNDDGWGPDLDRFVINPTPALDAAEVEEVHASELTPTQHYNALGQKVSNTYRGIIIQNGNKFINR